MKILIDIGHPAHVHLFKNFAWEMIKKGHEVFFTARDKEFEIYLLKKYNFNYISFGKHFSSRIGKIWGLIKFNILLLIQSIKFKPDLFLSHGSIYAAQVSWLLRKPHISFEDTGNMEQISMYRPFTDILLTSNVFSKNLGNKQIYYNGHHEIAYLNNKYFKENESFKKDILLSGKSRYALLRFVSWQATHDIGQSGIPLGFKRNIIELLEKNNLKVMISAEKKLDKEFDKYRLKLPPHLIHQFIRFADIVVSEGTTMAMEAAVLGTPSLYINSLQYDNCNDMMSYELLYSFKNIDGVLNKIEELIKMPNLKGEWQKRREKMLKDKIDVTAFFVWFVENYPESVQIMKKNPIEIEKQFHGASPEYQYNFR